MTNRPSPADNTGMSSGARVTDEVDFWNRRGDLRNCVRVVRARSPERLRWRMAVSGVTGSAGKLSGLERSRVVEPVREVVLDLEDRILRREAVLDARRHGVDLDRGEVLPVRTRWDLKRAAYLTGLDHEMVGRHLRLPVDFSSTIDTAGVVLVARALAASHEQRATRLFGEVDASRPQEAMARHERYMLQRANYDRDMARRWVALSRALAQGSR